MLSDNDLMRVQSITQSMKRTVRLQVSLTGNDNLFESHLANIARQLAGVSLNRITIEESYESSIPGLPCLGVSSERPANIDYLMLPEGPQFSPFLDAIAWLGEASQKPKFPGWENIQNLSVPLSILTFVATGCPHCPEAVRSVLLLACSNPMIRVSILDALYFEDVAAKYRVKATPTLIVNGGLTLVGNVKTVDLVEKLLGLSSENAMTGILKSMIDSGRAEDAAELLCERRSPEAILPIYQSNEFSQRMGALLVMEEALDINGRVLDPIAKHLTELMCSDDVGLRGDTASILGRIGTKDAISALEKALEDPDPDVRDSVTEALEGLK